MFENNDVQQISDRKAIAGLTQIKSYAQKTRMTFSVPDYTEESLDSASKYPQSEIQKIFESQTREHLFFIFIVKF